MFFAGSQLEAHTFLGVVW